MNGIALMNYELHPLCTLFPRLAGAEFDSLRDDIAANGLNQPIVLHRGMILDGGNRYRACVEAGVEPKFVEFNGDNLVSFVLSSNLHRRHMSAGQQAAIVASAQDWATAQAHGGNRSSAHVSTCLDTTEKRAAQSGASISTQRRADAVAKASPELAQKVAHGEVSLPKAVQEVAPQLAPRKHATRAPVEPEAPQHSETEELRDQLAELGKNLQDTIADNESMARVFESDDKLAAALDEAKRYREQNRVLEDRIRGLMNEKNEAIRLAKSWQRKFEKLEREMKAAANDSIDPAVGF